MYDFIDTNHNDVTIFSYYFPNGNIITYNLIRQTYIQKNGSW